MRTAQDTLKRFESLGDNCEFGFVQRKYGLEPGGLLRWAISPIHALVAALNNRFDEFYLYEELTPSADDMVRAERYGLAFHSAMRSSLKDGTRLYIDDDDKRHQIYAAEMIKMTYMRDKLIQILIDSAFIFVYKANRGVSEVDAIKLYDAIANYNKKNKLLVVHASDEGHRLKRIGNDIFLGCIDRFAPYERANDASYGRWIEICSDVLDFAEIV